MEPAHTAESASHRPKPVHLVVGGTGGIGEALVRRLLAEGATPVAAARDEGRLALLRDTLGIETHAVDVLVPGALEALVDDISQRHQRLDGLAHCVGSILLKPAHLTTDADWDQTLAINLTTAFRAVRAAAAAMTRSGGGSVVLCSSVAAQRGLPHHEAIAAAKAGIEGLVRSAAATYARARIRFNAVAPGLVRTPLSQRFWSAESSRKASEAMHPLGRLGEPDDIASAIAWLLDPAQSWVTGNVLPVDGGLGCLQAPAR